MVRLSSSSRFASTSPPFAAARRPLLPFSMMVGVLKCISFEYRRSLDQLMGIRFPRKGHHIGISQQLRWAVPLLHPTHICHVHTHPFQEYPAPTCMQILRGSERLLGEPPGPSRAPPFAGSGPFHCTRQSAVMRRNKYLLSFSMYMIKSGTGKRITNGVFRLIPYNHRL